MAVLPAAALAQSCNTADRSVLLILDASGSMNASCRTAKPASRSRSARSRVWPGFIPAQAQLSLRLYGAQSAVSRKNCEDTHVGVPFGPAGGQRRDRGAVDGAKAQGYTPIAYSLGQAANDFPADAKERVIVLVSDGKETCQGDPVVAARALAAKGITVHTVGFIVDTAARGQLQAIARVTGGTYFDAPVGPELPDTLKKALNACTQRVARCRPSRSPGNSGRRPRPIRPRHLQFGDGRKGRCNLTASGPRSICRRASTMSNSGRKLERDRGPSRRDHHHRPGGVEGRGHKQSQVFVNATVVDSETGETAWDF